MSELTEFQKALLIIIALLAVVFVGLVLPDTVREKINAFGRRIHRALMEGGGFFKI